MASAYVARAWSPVDDSGRKASTPNRIIGLAESQRKCLVNCTTKGAVSTCRAGLTPIPLLRHGRVVVPLAQYASATDKVRANIVSDNEKPQFESARATLALNSQTAASADPMQADEDRMRRALGLYGDQPRPRATPERTDSPPARPVERFGGTGHHKRRFVHDGEVPVTLVHGLVSSRREHVEGNGSRGANGQPTNRLEVAEAALAAEIATRERTERALQEAQATIHDLQTKLGHADLASQEAIETLRRERESAAELRGAWQSAEERIAEARQAQTAAEQALAALQDRIAEPVEATAEPPVELLPRRRGRKPRIQTAAEPGLAGLQDWIAEPVETSPDVPVELLPRRRGRKPRVQTAAEPVLAGLPEWIAEPVVPPDEPPAEPPPPRRRGRKPRAQTMAEAATATAKPRKTAARGRAKQAVTAREPKPIRWWVTPRGKKKR
jgi:hypothetical protein